MANLMHTIKGKAIVSINDHPYIREIFKGFAMDTVKLNYTVGGGAKRSEAGELIVRSW
jgi:DNA adenine methylase